MPRPNAVRTKAHARTVAWPDVISAQTGRNQSRSVAKARLKQHRQAHRIRREEKAAVLPEDQLRSRRASRQLLLRGEDKR